MILGQGTAADGMVRVTVSLDATADDIELDPRVMRMPSGVLAEHLRDAMRAARRQLFDRLAEDHETSGYDLEKHLDEMHTGYMRQMDGYRRIIDDINRRLGS
ncbi:YbaB/EbfC family nucleoid-associated protein [Sphaerisporangium corydalis]|uniref:YbaB/EbfC family nucleoid-associated protein n=1 Tax=Sphaerisporangium corydalis TaxID=1441875 RepID=A0ABV9EFD8_9ACTN|nr:YbaB/EbfC family nucleoid-associated protein [Sphaerisporangium corydalis]